MKNFFRKVAYGIGPNEDIPSDPLNWALNQVDEIPDFSWKGKIYSEKELRKHYRDWVYGDRKVLRKKYKDNKTLYKTHKDILRHKTGQKFWESLEISIRHNEGINSNHPVLAKLWMFWGNFFAISEKDFLANYSTGAYQREIIRPNLNQSFEKMVYDVTTSWAMIHHLDNSESAGPKSVTAGEEWRRRKKEPATINENHGRELLELHTVSPKAGYTQEDVIQLAYIMTGWQHRWSKQNLETGNVWFNSEYHQRGKKTVLGKEYKRGKKALAAVIKDLVNHPNCRDFVAERLCRYLITDEPTKEMKQPIIDAFKKSDGHLTEIHKAAIKVAFEYNNKFKKFQTPENWFIQAAKIGDLKLGGSSSYTSIAAPATFPDLTASTISCSLTIPPRAQFIIITPSFIKLIVPLEIKSLVAAVRGVCTVIMSERSKISSIVTRSIGRFNFVSFDI